MLHGDALVPLCHQQNPSKLLSSPPLSNLHVPSSSPEKTHTFSISPNMNLNKDILKHAITDNKIELYKSNKQIT